MKTSSSLFVNARCWTGDSVQPWGDCVLVSKRRFAFVGREADCVAPADAERIDCSGRLLVPGFVDGHAHLLNTGMAMRSVDLKGVLSREDAIRLVSERAAATPAGQWVRGAGWDQHGWAHPEFPDRYQLDSATSDRPAVLIHTSGHCVWVNSAALHVAGVTRDTQPPGGGEIGRDEDGEPTGILFDNAMELVYSAMPPVTKADRAVAVRYAIAHAHSLGVTGVHAMDVGRGELQALQTLHEQDQLQCRTRTFLTARRLADWLGQVRTGNGDDLLRLGGVKFFSDGALGSLTAWMVERYEGSSDHGFPLQSTQELEQQVRACLTGGLAPAIHAIGDRANGEVLDIFARARDLAPELPRRIEHAQLLRPEDIGRFGELDVTASVQPIHATQDMGKVDKHWGERGKHAYAFASLAAVGANLAFGSDSPVETIDPLAGLHAAVARRNAAGEPSDGWYPGERLSIESALRAYSGGCARAVNEEGRLGKIAPGYLGDAVLLSENVLTVEDPMQILDARVDVTVVDGEVVFRREEAW